jgi:hypothetical protein
MDENKRLKLVEIDYHVPKTCGLCIHSSFASPSGFWGECTKLDYNHAKHSSNPRNLSIYRGGTCKQFEPDPHAMEQLNRFSEFVR